VSGFTANRAIAGHGACISKRRSAASQEASMHKLVLSGIAVVALLAIVAGGRAAPVAPAQASAARPVCHAQMAMVDMTGATRVQLVADTQSGIQARRLLVADTQGGGNAPC
jgi:hypothetical protein